MKSIVKSVRDISDEKFTVCLTPFIINDPGLVDWQIEKVTNQGETFGAWW